MNYKGFSIIEILAAIVIIAIIFLMIFGGIN